MTDLTVIRRSRQRAQGTAGLDSARVTSITSSNKMSVYSGLDSLPVSGFSEGDKALVESDLSGNTRLYIAEGSGWYNVAAINLSPTLSIDPTGVIKLSKTGSATTVTLTATDSDDVALTYTVESDGNFNAIATLSQDSSVFTITPRSSDSAANGGTSTLTFKVADGINTTIGSRDFNLSFVLDSSASTIFLLRAVNGNTDNQFDQGNAGTTITENGNVYSSGYTPYRPGGYSAQFEGIAGGYGDWAYNEEIVKWDSGDFVIECSIYADDLDAWDRTSGSYEYPVMMCHGSPTGGTNYWSFGPLQDGSLMFYFWKGSINREIITDTGLIEEGKWHHIAFKAINGAATCELWIDGVKKKTVNSPTGTAQFSSGNNLLVGQHGGQNIKGYIKDLMLTRKNIGIKKRTQQITKAEADSAEAELLYFNHPGSMVGRTAVQDINKSWHLRSYGTGGGKIMSAGFSPFDASDNYDSAVHGGSVYLDGSGDYLAMPQFNLNANANTNFTYDTNEPFSVSCWVQFERIASTNTNENIFTFLNGSNYGGQSPGLPFALSSYHSGDAPQTNGLSPYFPDGSALAAFGDGFNIYNNVWYYFRVVRDGDGRCSFYMNGYRFASGTNKGQYQYGKSAPDGVHSGRTYVGAGISGNNNLKGYIADFSFHKDVELNDPEDTFHEMPTQRISTQTGSGEYSTRFATNRRNLFDASGAVDLNTISGATASTTQRKISSIDSLYLDGSNDYVAWETDYENWIGTGNDFTVEAWVYPTNNPSVWTVCGMWRQTTGYESWLFGENSNVWKFYWRPSSASTAILESSTAFSTNSWVHLAVTRKGDDFTLYVDGTSEDTFDGSSLTDLAWTSNLASVKTSIGTYHNGSNNPGAGGYAGGYIQDLRISRTCRYHGNFTPSTTALDL